MIETQNLSMSFGEPAKRLTVLSEVDLSIESGETVAVVGPSGSGKSTLLLLLAGLDPPTGGEVVFDGQPLSKMNSDQLADLRRTGIGIIFQSFHLVPSLTALGNAALPLQISGRPDAEEKARQMLERVGLADRQDHYPQHLSGGEQQRVAIARALVHQPKCVLADEPTGNLDAETGALVSQVLFNLNREIGSTLVLVTHDEVLAAQCQRVLRLRKGKLA